ncbi:DNA helicase [Lithospermum erythrorhizon]|uniref:DNA helicase n=1 Tax=Lithospermum erythrorhizon TaxID=34254 RepID=A0AAV3Q5C3_LITER
MMQRVILCPKNDFVDDINSNLIKRISGEERIYISDDRAKNAFDQGDYVDYLNSLEPRGLPQHKLVLKINCPVILLRNINHVEGLCNGTRLICKQLTPNVVGVVIATGQFKGKHVWIPRIPLEPHPADCKYLIPFIRRQFPLLYAYLYVALSRAKTEANIRVLIIKATCNDPGTKYTSNVVYDEVLVKASLP